MIPKYKDGGVVKVQYGSTKSGEPTSGDLQSAMRKRDIIQNSATPMPDNFTPAERKALDAYDRKMASEQAARDQRDQEMDANMDRGAKYYEESRRRGEQ